MISDYKQRKIVGGVYAVSNTSNNKKLVMMTTNLEGSKNRFAFSQNTNSCISPHIQDDWKKYGAKAFAFQILESLEKKETQSFEQFQTDIKALYEMLIDQAGQGQLYNKRIQ